MYINWFASFFMVFTFTDFFLGKLRLGGPIYFLPILGVGTLREKWYFPLNHDVSNRAFIAWTN